MSMAKSSAMVEAALADVFGDPPPRHEPRSERGPRRQERRRSARRPWPWASGDVESRRPEPASPAPPEAPTAGSAPPPAPPRAVGRSARWWVAAGAIFASTVVFAMAAPQLRAWWTPPAAPVPLVDKNAVTHVTPESLPGAVATPAPRHADPRAHASTDPAPTPPALPPSADAPPPAAAHPDPRPNLVNDTLFQEASAALARGDAETARTLLTVLLELHPDADLRVLLLVEQGLAARVDHPADAAAHFRAALALAPDGPMAADLHRWLCEMEPCTPSSAP